MKTFDTARLVGLLPYALIAVLSTLVAVIALQIWNAPLGVPFVYSGDGLAHGMHFEQLDGNPWYFTEPRLGAPFDQHFQDWPLPDVATLLIAKFFSIFTDSFAPILNATFLLGFPLAALTSMWVMRSFGVSRSMAVVLSVLYSVLPYHFVRGENHLFLSLYYAVPLGIWLAVAVAEGKALFTGRNWYTVRTVVFCLVVGWCGVYYAAFTVILVAAGAFVAFVIWRHKRAPLHGAGVLALIFIFVLSATAPTLAYHAEHGDNSLGTTRQAYESDVYGLKVAQMLMPVTGHAIDALSDFEHSYYLEFPLASEGGSSALGIIGSIGLLYLVGLLLVAAVRKRFVDSDARERLLASMSMLLILIGTIGGLSTFIGLLFTSQIRSWNRVSIFIGFMALCGLGLLIDRLVARIRRRHVSTLVAVAVLAVGIGDQALASWEPDKAAATEFLADQQYFGEIESSMPAGSEIFQLPRMSFPESGPVGDLGAYEQLKPYLHTGNLEWSFGGIKGRLESEWQSRLADPATDTEGFVDDLVDAGFEGIYLDRRGYEDSGAAIENPLREILGSPGQANQAGNKVFYDIRSVAVARGVDQAEARDLLFPAYAQQSEMFYSTEYDAQGSWWWSSSDDAHFFVSNTTGAALDSIVEFELLPGNENRTEFEIVWPDGNTEMVSASREPIRVERDLRLEPGPSRIEIRSDATQVQSDRDWRSLYFRLYNVDVSPR